ncbi:sugar ABC transporter permease [soil metagenome]|jgi:ABC-type sugar transport system permease subunit
MTATSVSPGRSWRQRFDTRILPVVLVTPAMVLITGLIGWPILRTLWLSFREAGLRSLTTGESDFVGLSNYAEALSDPHLRRVVLVTLVFGLLCVVGTMTLGMAAALLLNRPFPGRVFVTLAVLLPWAMPRVAAATVWKWMFNDRYGFVNWSLSNLGLDFDGYAWFVSPLPAFFAIGVVVVWQSFPFVAISLLAGLQSIPDDVIDAARIDGASAWQRLRHVTMPMLKPVLLVLIVLSTIWDFKVFDQVFVMTGGGPARSTEVLSIATYREAFTQLDFGLGSALAMLMFAILAVVTVIYIRLIKEEEEL